jgi:hypothetical protein
MKRAKRPGLTAAQLRRKPIGSLVMQVTNREEPDGQVFMGTPWFKTGRDRWMWAIPSETRGIVEGLTATSAALSENFIVVDR